MDKKDPDMSLPPTSSSVVMKAIDATTFTEMEAFVKDLENRPIERLLKDLPHLATLATTKVSLVSYVIAGKYKAADAAERTAIRDAIQSTASQLEVGEKRDRVAAILDRLR